MQASGKPRVEPGLKQLVVEASQALARLDADRLEELARSCEALNDQAKLAGEQQYAALVMNAREASGEMAILARVLEATRANANVMNRLRQLREGRLEYGQELSSAPGAQSERKHGNN